MGRLANHTYRQVIKKLKKLGFEFYRQAAGSHELWYHPERKIFTTDSKSSWRYSWRDIKGYFKTGPSND